VVRTDLAAFLADYDGYFYGAYLSGQILNKTQFAAKGLLVMGSESHGIREQVAPFINQKITIPAFGGAESLNVAMATGIILDNIKRQDYTNPQ
jgi:TrmH family RNA methyltransferase